MSWGQNEWLWVSGIIIAAFISWIITRQYGNRRRKLLFTWDSVQLLPHDGPAKGALEVSYEGIRVDDPFLIKIVIKNLGPTDIATAHFDGGSSLRVEFPEGYVAALDSDLGAATMLELGSGYVAIPPQLLKRNAIITLDVLVDGPSEPVLVSDIIDTDVVTADAAGVALTVASQVADASVVAALPGLRTTTAAVKEILGSRRRY